MTDIQSPTLLYIKGGLMLLVGLLVGLLAAGLLLAERPDMRTALLLGVALWGFCRAYYFAFYVIDHYIDPGSRYAGLMAFLRETVRRRRQRRPPEGH